MATLLIIDGNSLVNRAFYGVKALTTKDGRYTNAIVGFLNMLGRLREQTEADHIAVAFDRHEPTFRHAFYPEYKAGRKGMPPELFSQLEPLKAILRALGITLVEQSGYEADDILGTLSRVASERGDRCFLATGDRDAFQLVDDRVTVLLSATRAGAPETVAYDPAAIREKYGLTPEQLIDLKALQGDASDHIPGVPGVGEKTALELMQRFGSLDAIYADLAGLDVRDSLRQKLAAGEESARMSLRLGTICRTAPVDTEPSHYAVGEMKKEELARLLQDLELHRWMEKWGLQAPAVLPDTAAAEPLPRRNVEGNEAARAIAAAARQTGRLTVFCADENGLGRLAVGAGDRLAYVDPLADGYEEIVSLLTDETVAKTTHNSKKLYAALLADGKQPTGFSLDTMLAAYLLDPLSSDYSLMTLMADYGIPAPDGDGLPGFEMLADRLTKKIGEQELTALLTEVEQPLALVLASMENDGCAVDRDGIAAFGRELSGRIASLQQSIWDRVGYEFNLNSPKQLGKALFEDLGLPAGKKTKSGYSTGADVLEKLRFAHPVVEELLEYRTLSKLNGTYCEGLLKVIAPDGRIHSVFNQTETRTGRISSSEPNLQNIPVRSEVGRQMRHFFLARPGWELVDADYSQIELRVLAHMAQEPTMLAAFNGDGDIHRSTAAQVFGVPEEQVTPLMRSRAKAVNFGIIYGIGAHSLSEQLGIPYGEAKDYIERYLHHFGAVDAFMQRLIDDATQKGYGETLFHRRRPLPELKAGNAMTRKFGERVARNMPIQGTAADIIKIAMIRVYRRLQAENLQARLILQIHDELLVEAPPQEVETVTCLLREEMERAADLSVKLEVDVHHGKDWYEAKG